MLFKAKSAILKQKADPLFALKTKIVAFFLPTNRKEKDCWQLAQEDNIYQPLTLQLAFFYSIRLPFFSFSIY